MTNIIIASWQRN